MAEQPGGNPFNIDLAILSDSGLKTLAGKHGIKWEKGVARGHVVQQLRDSGIGRVVSRTEEDTPCESEKAGIESLRSTVEGLQDVVRCLSEELKSLGEFARSAIPAEIASMNLVNSNLARAVDDLGVVQQQEVEKLSNTIRTIRHLPQPEQRSLQERERRANPAAVCEQETRTMPRSITNETERASTIQPQTYASALTERTSSRPLDRMERKPPRARPASADEWSYARDKRQRAQERENDKKPPRTLVGATPIECIDLFIGNLDLESTAQDIISHCKIKNVTATWCRIFPSRKRFGTACAKLTIAAIHGSEVLSENFWPGEIQARKWVPRSNLNEGISFQPFAPEKTTDAAGNQDSAATH